MNSHAKQKDVPGSMLSFAGEGDAGRKSFIRQRVLQFLSRSLEYVSRTYGRGIIIQCFLGFCRVPCYDTRMLYGNLEYALLLTSAQARVSWEVVVLLVANEHTNTHTS